MRERWCAPCSSGSCAIGFTARRRRGSQTVCNHGWSSFPWYWSKANNTKKKKQQHPNQKLSTVWIDAVEGGREGGAPLTVSILLILPAERSEEHSSSAGTNLCSHRLRSLASLSGVFFWTQDDPVVWFLLFDCFFFSFFNAEREREEKKILRSISQLLFRSSLLSQQSRSWLFFSPPSFFFRFLFECNITGFTVGAFPFINVHWCSRKRGGDKVGLELIPDVYWDHMAHCADLFREQCSWMFSLISNW